MSTQLTTASGGNIVAPAGSWADRFGKLATLNAEKAAAAQSDSGTVGAWITANAGLLSFKGSPVAGNYLDVIVIDACRENQYYDARFDRDNKRSPICYAFGDDDKTMEVSKDCEKPQAASCDACEHNKFGTSETGKGKACKNVMRIGVIPASPVDSDFLSRVDPAWIKVPVMSVKNYLAYVQLVKAKYGRPTFGVITRVAVKPDPRAQFVWTFEDIAPLPEDNALQNVIEARYNQIFDLIQFPHKKNDAAPDASRLK